MSTQPKPERATNGSKIGKYTKYQREKRKISLTGFAKNIGVDPSFLQRLEQGVYQGISIDVIEKLARGFEMRIEDFLRKCKISSYQRSLPTLEFYLREMYQLPPEAVADCMNYLAFLQHKYRQEIRDLKKQHTTYWKKQA